MRSGGRCSPQRGVVGLLLTASPALPRLLLTDSPALLTDSPALPRLHAAGQGLRAGESTTLGSSGSSASLQQLYARSKAMRRSWRQTRGTTTSCKSASGGAVLCGSDTADSSQAYAALWLATSPAAYSSHVPDNTGGVRLFTPPQTQGDCNSCTAFAMAAALQAAVAWGLQIDAAKANVSVQAMYFGCSAERGPMLDCSSGSTLTAAAEAAVQRAPRLPLADCLPYKPDVTGELSEAELCHGSCTTTNPFVAQGKLRVTKLGSIWQAQRHILQYGSVASRFDVHDDLQPFYADKANARKVYRKTDGAKLLFAHAVVSACVCVRCSHLHNCTCTSDGSLISNAMDAGTRRLQQRRGVLDCAQLMGPQLGRRRLLQGEQAAPCKARVCALLLMPLMRACASSCTLTLCALLPPLSPPPAPKGGVRQRGHSDRGLRSRLDAAHHACSPAASSRARGILALVLLVCRPQARPPITRRVAGRRAAGEVHAGQRGIRCRPGRNCQGRAAAAVQPAARCARPCCVLSVLQR